jgi:hypothetical protein
MLVATAGRMGMERVGQQAFPHTGKAAHQDEKSEDPNAAANGAHPMHASR